jgi:hypothetical protein
MDPEYAGPAGAADTGFGRWGFLRGAAMLIGWYTRNSPLNISPVISAHVSVFKKLFSHGIGKTHSQCLENPPQYRWTQ